MQFFIVLMLSVVFTAAIFIVINLLPKKKLLQESSGKQYLDALLKTMALIYFVWCVFRVIYYDTFILVINGGAEINGLPYSRSDISHSILRWGHSIATVAFPMAAFFKSRLFKNISIFVCLPFAIATALNFDAFASYYTAAGGRGLTMPMGFRSLYFYIEVWMAITLPLLLIFCDRHMISLKNKKEWLVLLLVLPFVILRMCPVYVPQSIFGYVDWHYNMLSVGNIMWILLIIAEIIILNRVYRFRSYRDRFMLCMFLALASFVEFNAGFMMGFNIRRLPFQLCNLGAYFFVFALLTDNSKFFNFVFLANITGAVIAISVPDTEGGSATSFWAFHYLVEHTLVLVVPFMCNILRIFPRISKARAIKHLTIGFACYFLFCLTLGTILNGITDITKQPRVNFFYIFDIYKVIEVLPFVAPIMRGVTLFGRFTIYPIFQLTVFGLFWSACIFVYFIVQKLYEIIDDHLELRLARIDLQEKITKRKSKALRKFAD